VRKNVFAERSDGIEGRYFCRSPKIVNIILLQKWGIWPPFYISQRWTLDLHDLHDLQRLRACHIGQIYPRWMTSSHRKSINSTSSPQPPGNYQPPDLEFLRDTEYFDLPEYVPPPILPLSNFPQSPLRQTSTHHRLSSS